MRRLAVFAGLLCAAGPLAAQENCAALRALTNAEGRGFAGLRLGYLAPEGLSVFAGENPWGLPPAAECELSAFEGEQMLSCEWRFETAELADGHFGAAAAAFRRCTGIEPQADIADLGDVAWQVRGRQRFDRDGNGVAAQVTVDRVHYRREAGAVEHRVVVEAVIAAY